MFLYLFVILLCFDTSLQKEEKPNDGVTMPEDSKMNEDGMKKCDCGIRRTSFLSKSDETNSKRVIRGDIVNPIYKYPWMIALFENGQHICGGSIISEHYVVTAAHCVIRRQEVSHPDSTRCMRLQDNNKYCTTPYRYLRLKYSGNRPGLNNVVKIQSIIGRQKFSLPSHDYDIVLLKTKEKLPCNRYTAPICLPTLSGLYSVGSNATIAGWGTSEVIPTGTQVRPSNNFLREATLKIRDGNSCKLKPGRNHLCALGNKQNTCYGDSGGPLFKEVKGRNYLIGVSSFGTGEQCDYDSAEYYIKVTRFLPWIRKKMKQKRQKSQIGKKEKKPQHMRCIYKSFQT